MWRASSRSRRRSPSYPVVPRRPDAPRVAARRLPRAHHALGRAGHGGGGRRARRRRRACSFVVLTDHNDFAPREPAVRGRGADGPRRGALDAARAPGGVRPAASRWTASGATRGGSRGGGATQAGGVSVLAHPVQQKQPLARLGGRAAGHGLRALLGGHVLPGRAAPPASPGCCPRWGRLSNPVHGVMTLVAPQPEPTERLLELDARSAAGGAVRARRARPAAATRTSFGRWRCTCRRCRAALAAAARTPRAAAEQVVRGPRRAAGPSASSARCGEPEGFALRGAGREARARRRWATC